MGQEGARGRGRPRVERAPRGRASPSHTRASCVRARARACVRACVCAQRPLCGGLAAGQLWTGCFAHALLRGVGGAVEPPAGAQQGCLQPCSGCWTAHLCAGLRHGRARQACVTAGQGREDVLTPLPSDPPPPWHPPPRTACTTLRSGVRARHERGAAVRACVPAGGRRGRAARDGLRAGQARPGRRAGAVCACEARRRGRGALCRRRRHRRRRYAHRFAAHQEGRAARAARCATRRRGARLGTHDACRGARAGGRASGPRLWLWRRHLSLHL